MVVVLIDNVLKFTYWKENGWITNSQVGNMYNLSKFWPLSSGKSLSWYDAHCITITKSVPQKL